MLHRRHGHRDVPGPGRGNVDDVDVLAGHQLFPDVLGAAVHFGPLAADLLAAVGGAFRPVGAQVADSDHFGELDVEAVIEMGHAAAEADVGDADLVERLGGEVVDRFLARRARPGGHDVRADHDAGGQGHRTRGGFRTGAAAEEAGESGGQTAEGGGFQEIAAGGVHEILLQRSGGLVPCTFKVPARWNVK